jgi:hypothetical protein
MTAAVQTFAAPVACFAVELWEVTQKMALLRLAGSGEGVSMPGEQGEGY